MVISRKYNIKMKFMFYKNTFVFNTNNKENMKFRTKYDYIYNILIYLVIVSGN